MGTIRKAKATKKALRSQQFATKQISHKVLLDRMASEPFLGHARAVVIVCACANTSPLNLSRTLDELGVDGVSFQKCVFDSVGHLGYVIDIDQIPNSGNTKLIEVVNAIEGAPAK